MKKILIVNNNMKIGGVQKSLYNLLWTVAGKYDVTLLLFRAAGEYMDKIPDSVKVMECTSLFRYLGISQGECKGPAEKLSRGILAGLSKIFGRALVMKLLFLTQRKLPETYDCAISFLHNGRPEAFYGGVQDFVLNCVRAQKKVAFLHCDYQNCGANHPSNNRMLGKFDVIAACSDGCRNAFVQVLPELADKCVTVRNFHRIEQIRDLSAQEPVRYDERMVNIVMVSRLAHEKGIDRAITAVTRLYQKGMPVRLHIVGSGPEEAALKKMVDQLKAADTVVFCGQQENPYRLMKNADLFLMTSYHEAAPMVIEEACCLGLPVLTMQTTSSVEMVTDAACGWVCENDQSALENTLEELLLHSDTIRQVKKRLSSIPMDNRIAMAQFAELVEG